MDAHPGIIIFTFPGRMASPFDPSFIFKAVSRAAPRARQKLKSVAPVPAVVSVAAKVPRSKRGNRGTVKRARQADLELSSEVVSEITE
jgi:hypothetical protein